MSRIDIKRMTKLIIIIFFFLVFLKSVLILLILHLLVKNKEILITIIITNKRILRNNNNNNFLLLKIGYFSITKGTPKQSGSASASASASASHKNPIPSASASKSVNHGDDKVKPTATLPSSVIKTVPTPTPSSGGKHNDKRVRVMCVAYPDEDDKMTTTCREMPVSSTVKPKVHGTHKRQEKPSTTSPVAVATPKPVENEQ